MFTSYKYVLIILISTVISVNPQKITFAPLSNYSAFLNHGEKKTFSEKLLSENEIFKSKVDILGELFKKNVESLKKSPELDIIFLIDASSSVGEDNFRSELKFVKKLLSDVTIDLHHTRVGIITFSSSEYVLKNVDEISVPRNQNNKCLLLNKQLTAVNYTGGETFTLGAFKISKEIFENSRNSSRKVIFLITDGFSNGGDPVPVAEELKTLGITIFTIGIRNGNYKELYKLSSEPGEIHSYLLDSFEEFESLARKALHVDLKVGDYIPLGINSPCDTLCKEGDCCHKDAVCTCGTSTGHYSCVCPAGYYGSGLKEDGCSLCPVGFYSDGPNLCIPCPDAFHISKPPAYGRESCTCKIGYQENNDTQICEAIQCKKLKEPRHGYFVKKSCDTVINSACGTRCDVGYNLIGTSIRLCQNNGTWTGTTPSCQVRTCESLSPPAFGSMICSHSDLGITYSQNQTNFPVDTVCSFQCEKGKIFIGSKHRTCLPVSKWNGLRAMCRQVKCNKIPNVANAVIEPRSCTYGKQSYGKKCTIRCKEGFKTVGPKEKYCTGKLGSWNTKEYTYCQDTTPPVIKCPKNVTGTANFAVNYGNVLWEAPVIKDNSDDDVIVWTKPPIANLSNFPFLIGKTNITYYAEDSSKNQGECNTVVTILDNERPIIENCINPPVFFTEDRKGANVTWEEPYIYDNSHHATVTRSHSFGYFNIGITTVTYAAVDDSGNKNLCQMNITVKEAKCDDFQAPENGRSECSKKNKTIICTASCKDGFLPPLSSTFSEQKNETDSVVFTCNVTENIWFNEDGLPIPECSPNELSKEIEQNATTEVETDFDCSSELLKMSQVENDINSFLTKEICTENCTVTTNLQCLNETMNELEEEQSNVINTHVKRSTRNQKKSRKKKLRINIQLKTPYNNATRIMHELQYKNTTIQLNEPRFLCPLGYIPRKNRCVQCPRGTYQVGVKCKSCTFGFYNSGYGKTSCTSCPIHFSTAKLRAKSITECKQQCPPGTHARKKVLKNSKRLYRKIIERATLQPFCRSCPIGFYQDAYGQLKCSSCPKGYTTYSYGSTNVGQCVETAEETCMTSRNICNHGTCVVRDRLHYSCNCLKGYIGSHCEKHTEVCRNNPCHNGGSCIITHDENNQPRYKCLCSDNFFGSYCEQEVNKCKLKCMNGGSCLEYDEDQFMCLCAEGYEGEFCQPVMPYCTKDLCQNNGTCIESSSTYDCKCPGGYIGKRCHLLPCDYKPCPQNAACQNIKEDYATTKSYRCVCSEGWTGQNCDVKIDFCSPNPCQNNGTCQSFETSFRCTCVQPFFGTRCEKKYDSSYVLVFERFRTADYVKLPPLKKNLREITVCMWLKVTDTFNYGTLVSYATRENDNVFTLTDYTGLIMYVNGQYIATDVFLNDGIWHHVCATWQKTDGVYQVYIDGNLRQFGSGLSTNRDIAANGYMIIGQEQDTLGGKFSQSETFVGRMTLIDMWSRVLSKEDILKHFHECENPTYGDLYSWPEFQLYIQGDLKKEPSVFCNDCSQPKKIINGFVELKRKKAFYGCKEGYKIGNDYKNGRTCLKSSKWEGQREPYCRRVYCGPPGFLRNGFIYGSNYYFEDKVTCVCTEGYNLTGEGTLTCGKDGKWEPTKPECVGPQCRAFKIPPHGNLTIFAETPAEEYREDKTLFDVGTQIEVSCGENTNLVGESVLTCEENGIWDKDPPLCESPFTTTEKPPRCAIDQLTSTPENGYIVEESVEAYQKETTNIIEFNCNIGFTAEGLNYTECIDGSWSEFSISCSRKYCGHPGVPPNGVVLGNSYRFGDEVTFECDTGYVINGTSSMTCGDDGNWEGQLPTCERIICERPNDLKNGKIIDNGTHFGDVISFQCDKGFTLKGSAVLKCGKAGSWSDNMPKCEEIFCGKPEELDNGLSFGRGYNYGDFVSFECNEGYNLLGNRTIKCEADGTWGPAKPRCVKISCGDPGILENGVIVGNAYEYGNKITFKCNEGFILKGQEANTCNKEGQWLPQKPNCTKVSCEIPESFQQSIIPNKIYYYEDIITFKCPVGYYLQGSQSASCDKDGKWTAAPKCLKKYCGSPGIIDNGLIYGNSYYFEDKIIFECNEGFDLIGSISSTCSEDGTWKPKLPHCRAVPTTTVSTTSSTTSSAVVCRSPRMPLNMVKVGNDQNSSYPPGSSLILDCVEGYKMLGNNIIRCSKLGRWTRLQGKCRRISCRQPEVNKNTVILGDSYLYEDQVTIICSTGAEYKLICNKHGIWEGSKDSSC